MVEAFVSGDVLHLACGVCPSRRLPVGEFDVYERPCKEAPFDPSDGFRYSADRVPVCVHPEKVGLPVAMYKSEGAPLVKKVELPETEAELVPYLHDLLYGAAPALLDGLIEQAYAEIPRVFPDVDVLETLRRALS
ncbi:hypothetical protein OG453_44715 [Streptomyces sp. NBC_01381]|uniref:hypothetical protein n=1 Tax=Streptomyces sp. NBC_01381 TaxID=2903845 RepID=UPI00224FDE0B|nr:hypothetical protein [Streptomyces sp. NBC_01381]MCX4673662.1 hypothetical protein [Streptomyces sp. NBC_01381]